MTISTVGSRYAGGGSGRNTLSVTPTALNNVLALEITSQGTTIPSFIVSGGGIATWHPGTSYLDTSTSVYLDIWWGTITSTGSTLITVSGISGSAFNVLWAQEFSQSHAGYRWSLIAASPVAGSTGASLGSGTAVSWPVLTASGASEYLYLGNSLSSFGSMVAGSSAGFAYSSTGFTSDLPVYSLTFTGTGNPTATQTNTGAYDTVAAILGVSITATASLTVTPAQSVTATVQHVRTASITVSRSAVTAVTHGHTRSAVLQLTMVQSIIGVHGSRRAMVKVIAPSYTSVAAVSHRQAASTSVVMAYHVATRVIPSTPGLVFRIAGARIQ